MFEIDNSNSSWKQHFPTYNFKNRDIALEEYKESAKCLTTEERIFLNASNITLLSSAALGSVILGSSSDIIKKLNGIMDPFVIYISLIFIFFIYTAISLKYFADRHKSIVFASRKVVILRRMLGLSYGYVNLILPSWRVEGANQPMSIKLFPGWLSAAAYPFWILSIISTSIAFILISNALSTTCYTFSLEYNHAIALLSTLCWFLINSAIFRISLLEAHESFRLLAGQFIAKLLNIKIFKNTEQIIYRAKLSHYETSRMSINLNNIFKILIFVEDRSFYEHKGFSYKAIIRGILGLFKLKRKSGGSTITQQLFRTLFITDMNKTIRRKILEILLSPWLDAALGKNNIINIYISSVRFEYKCFGIVHAMNHFFGEIKKDPSLAESFFLVERLSNVRSSLLVNKITDTIKQSKSNHLISNDDIKEIVKIYDRVINKKLIKATNDQILQLKRNLQDITEEN